MQSPLDHARRLLAIAQTGLHFSRDPYDRERYEELAQIATALLAERTQHAASELHAAWFVEQGYATPKIDVRAAIFRRDQDEVLLVRERSDGKWTLPGGWADVNDPPSHAILKEVEQESGYRARLVKLAAVYDRNLHAHPASLFHVWKFFFIAEIVGGAARPSTETSEVAFFPVHSLPELSTTRVSAAQIARMRMHAAQRALPTEFD